MLQIFAIITVDGQQSILLYNQAAEKFAGRVGEAMGVRWTADAGAFPWPRASFSPSS